VNVAFKIGLVDAATAHSIAAIGAAAILADMSVQLPGASAHS
jgi:hypothetical protein